MDRFIRRIPQEAVELLWELPKTKVLDIQSPDSKLKDCLDLNYDWDSPTRRPHTMHKASSGDDALMVMLYQADTGACVLYVLIGEQHADHRQLPHGHMLFDACCLAMWNLGAYGYCSTSHLCVFHQDRQITQVLRDLRGSPLSMHFLSANIVVVASGRLLGNRAVINTIQRVRVRDDGRLVVDGRITAIFQTHRSAIAWSGRFLAIGLASGVALVDLTTMTVRFPRVDAQITALSFDLPGDFLFLANETRVYRYRLAIAALSPLLRLVTETETSVRALAAGERGSVFALCASPAHVLHISRKRTVCNKTRCLDRVLDVVGTNGACVLQSVDEDTGQVVLRIMKL
jgi:hypothetical protein